MPNLLDEIQAYLKKAKKREKTQFIDQLLKEKDLEEALREAGLPSTLEDIQSRARERPEGVLTAKEILDRIDKILEVAVIKVIEEITILETLKNIESIENMPNLPFYGSEGVSFRQAESGAGAWTTPTGHSDPEAGWSYETNAYDENVETRALGGPTSIYYPSWTDFLYLTFPSAISNKLRFYAWYDPDLSKKVDVDVLRDGVWTNVYEGAFADHAWVEKTFTEGTVTEIRIRFYVNCISAKLYEIDLWQVSESGGEMYVVLLAWDGSTLKKVRCDPDGYLLTKAG